MNKIAVHAISVSNAAQFGLKIQVTEQGCRKGRCGVCQASVGPAAAHHLVERDPVLYLLQLHQHCGLLGSK